MPMMTNRICWTIRNGRPPLECRTLGPNLSFASLSLSLSLLIFLISLFLTVLILFLSSFLCLSVVPSSLCLINYLNYYAMRAQKGGEI